MSGTDTAYNLEVNMPNLPKGTPVQIAGLGTFENGSSYEITKDEANGYRSFHTQQIPVYDEKTNEYRGSKVQPGPTLLEAAKTMYGINVATPSTSSSTSTTTSSTSSSSTTTTEGGVSQ